MWAGALFGAMVAIEWAAALTAVAFVSAATVRLRVVGLIAVAALGLLSGAIAAERTATVLDAGLPSGRGTIVGTAATDTTPFGDGSRFVLRPSYWLRGGDQWAWTGPPIMVITDSDDIEVGDTVEVTGLIRRAPGSVRGIPVAGRVRSPEATVVGEAGSWVFGAGNAVRDRVRSQLGGLGSTPESALLAGFLIGDITELPERDVEALRRAGLTHFVAVSGSNVALVLGAWWLVLGPTGAGNRIRAATGLVVLAVFVVATRWEASVIRAATMAGIVMSARALGVALDAWGALGAAVIVLLAVSGELAFSVGFQLSALATAGVLIGMRIFADRRPRAVWALLAASLSAQAAVAPLLLLHFGTVPLLAPLANLLAAPLVTAATALAGTGVVTGWQVPIHAASFVGGLVLEIAAFASGWPQLGAVAAVGVVTAVAATWSTSYRPLVVVGLLLVSTMSMIPPGPPDVPTIVFLDVGQGDAVLIRDPAGAVILLDGGRDPAVLRNALRNHGVHRIDLLIASHGDADHVGGFEGLVDFVAIGAIWVPRHAALGEILDGVVTSAPDRGIPIEEVGAGDSARVGSILLEVLGPLRRYDTDNDGSVVIKIPGPTSVLLPGDIGAVAQRELGAIDADVVMVPHHGAATTDLGWLAGSAGRVAVISVGPNTYGHPAPEVVAVLEETGAIVLTTQESGDIVIPLE